TKYESSKMRVVDYLSQEEFNQVIKDASYVITHGGAGTIMTCLKMNKKILAAARLASYHEHVNDHQTQLLSSFEDMGYLIYMKELDDIAPYIEQIQTFEPKQYQSNTANMISLIEQFIDNL
ncbi:MAG: exopolysaccharide biosynthesis protein, partial [Erysipelotrichaceae bacterium]|nr:exopolysaccharide biosynthesis protein [Erysipelotrichaceae bacterium]